MTYKFIMRQIMTGLFLFCIFLVLWRFSSKTDNREILFHAFVDMLIIMLPQWFGLSISLLLLKKGRLRARLMLHNETEPHWGVGTISYAALFKKEEMLTRLHFGKIVYSKGHLPINMDKLRLFYALLGIALIVSAIAWPYGLFLMMGKTNLTKSILVNYTVILLVSGMLCAKVAWNWVWKKAAL